MCVESYVSFGIRTRIEFMYICVTLSIMSRQLVEHVFVIKSSFRHGNIDIFSTKEKILYRVGNDDISPRNVYVVPQQVWHDV